MSDIAAVSLGEWFLTDSPDRSIDTLVEIFQGDPPLALWVALKADRLSYAPPRSLGDLAALLANHGLAWLQWDAGPASVEMDAVLAAEIAARVAAAVVVSEAAAEAAALHGEDASRQARFLGLLGDPAEWLVVLKRVSAGQSRIRLPKSLSPSHFTRDAVEAFELAISQIGVLPAMPASLDLLSGSLGVSPSYLQRGVDAASRWGAVHLAARSLPRVMAKLARLTELERSFQAEVEAGKIAAMAEFAAGAGHEINNPLAVIAGRAQLLLREETDPERRRDLALINVQAMRVNELIADMRLFASPPEVERQTLDLIILVRRLADEIQSQTAEQETTLRLIEGVSEVTIEADPVQFTVAMKALCQNALDALGHRGRIEITVTSDGNQASVTVADDGPGILPEQRPHIFEPFYSARQAGRGVGMGLSKCWRIVTQHGGQIEVDRRPGSGAMFTIRLPLATP